MEILRNQQQQQQVRLVLMRMKYGEEKRRNVFVFHQTTKWSLRLEFYIIIFFRFVYYRKIFDPQIPLIVS